MKRDFKGVWIPAVLWLNSDISITEKCLLVEIDSLDNDQDKGCFASNEYLGKFIGVSPGRCANMVSDLKKRGYVEQVFFDGRNRGLRVPNLHKNNNNLNENVKAEPTKTLKQPSRKSEHSNTVNNNSINIENRAFDVVDNKPLLEVVNKEILPAVQDTINNLTAYKTATESFISLAAAARLQYPEESAEPYFLNEQQKGRYYMLTVPTAQADIHSWLSKHLAGINAWKLRERQFSNGKVTSETTTKLSNIKLPKV